MALVILFSPYRCTYIYVQCLTSSPANFTKQKYENLKRHNKHPKLSLEIGFGQIHPIIPEESGSENLTQNWQD